MLIGLLSDTHGNFSTTAAAVNLLRQRGAEMLIHCGDVGSERILDLLAGHPAAFVWGNCDWDRAGLRRYADALSVQCLGGCGEIEVDGKRIAITHGDDALLCQRLLRAQGHDYFVQGHTHLRNDQRIGRTRLVNPGALHRSSNKSVALLNPASDEVAFLFLNGIDQGL